MATGAPGRTASQRAPDPCQIGRIIDSQGIGSPWGLRVHPRLRAGEGRRLLAQLPPPLFRPPLPRHPPGLLGTPNLRGRASCSVLSRCSAGLSARLDYSAGSHLPPCHPIRGQVVSPDRCSTGSTHTHGRLPEVAHRRLWLTQCLTVRLLCEGQKSVRQFAGNPLRTIVPPPLLAHRRLSDGRHQGTHQLQSERAPISAAIVEPLPQNSLYPRTASEASANLPLAAS